MRSDNGKNQNGRFQIGLVAAIAYVVSGAFQEVYLGSLFQEKDPILVMEASFALSTLIFLILGLGRGQLANIRRAKLKSALCLNVTTAVSWICFFMALKYIEPAIVGAISFCVGPLMTTFFNRFFRRDKPVLFLEGLSSGGLATVIALLSGITISGRSSIGQIHASSGVLGIVMAFVGAVGIIGNTFFSKNLAEQGLKAIDVMLVRFWFLLVIGAFLLPECAMKMAFRPEFAEEIVIISVATVVLPLFLLQVGIEILEPITISLIMASMPAITFFLQLFDSRLVPSFLTLTGIFLCLCFSTIGIFARVAVSKK